jgi:DNA helicase II / ATP-dependent DNA helicase PcrA
MPDDSLNDEQQLALGPGIKLIEAGPGAGKTRTVVARMNVRSTSAGGIALISFTNAAADEAKRRTAGSEIAHPPNFIGTFDKFLHMFVVTPWHLRTFGTKPDYVDSWDDLGNGLQFVRHGAVPGTGLKLASFSLADSGKLTYPDEAPSADRVYANQLLKAGYSPSDLASHASRIVESLLDKGLYDCDCARLQALEVLRSDESWLTDRLSLRFSEIIVDEFQDCSETELEIIDALTGLGIDVVVVADPDQAIYEFRQASPSVYKRYRQSLDPATIAELTTNYRSTPAICRLVNSLRVIGKSPGRSIHDDDASSIFILVGSPKFQREQQAALLANADIPIHKSLILSHRKKDSALLAGIAVDTSGSDHRTFRILRLIAILRTSRSTRIRKEEVRKLGITIVELFDWDPAKKILRTSEKKELLQLSDSALGSIASGLTHKSVEWRDAEEARSQIVAYLQEALPSSDVPLKSLRVSLQKLKAEHWAWWNAALSNAADIVFPASHIHGVKGLEFDAVLLALNASTRNPSNVLDDWETGQSTDALRVLYVGGSRAKKLLSIASPPKSADQLRRILDLHGVPTTWMIEEAAS